jgi:hypothetical protein
VQLPPPANGGAGESVRVRAHCQQQPVGDRALERRPADSVRQDLRSAHDLVLLGARAAIVRRASFMAGQSGQWV